VVAAPSVISGLLGWSGRFADSVADARDGEDGVGVAEFLSKPGDVDHDGVGKRVDVLVPRLLKEFLGA